MSENITKETEASVVAKARCFVSASARARPTWPCTSLERARLRCVARPIGKAQDWRIVPLYQQIEGCRTQRSRVDGVRILGASERNVRRSWDAIEFARADPGPSNFILS
jgi:hypothetical protein